MQQPLELAGDGVGRADGQVLEAAGLVEVEGGLRRAAQVLVGQLVDVGVGRAPLALTARVPVARQLVDQLGALDHDPLLEHEEPGPLAIGEQDADRLVLAQHGLELADRGRVVDDDLRAHRDGQLDDLPEVARRAGEDGQAAGGLAVDAPADVRLDALEVVVDGAVAVGPLARVPEHRVELVLDVLVADQATSVDVEVARGDRRLVPPDPRELPDGVFGDEGHSTSRSDGWDHTDRRPPG